MPRLIQLKAIWLFYKPLIVPSFLSALFVGFINQSSGIAALSFVFFASLFHMLKYELGEGNAYWFFHNIGLSKFHLWASTISISVTISISITLAI